MSNVKSSKGLSKGPPLIKLFINETLIEIRANSSLESVVNKYLEVSKRRVTSSKRESFEKLIVDSLSKELLQLERQTKTKPSRSTTPNKEIKSLYSAVELTNLRKQEEPDIKQPRLNLDITPEDDPYTLAEELMTKHGLPAASMESVVAQIISFQKTNSGGFN